MIEVILIVAATAVVAALYLCRKTLLSRRTSQSGSLASMDDAPRIKTLASAGSEIGLHGLLKTAKVEEVINGDTLIVSSRCFRKKIRLDAIVCPEEGQEWSDNATRGLINLIEGRQIAYEAHDIDRYGRTVATLYVRDESGNGWTDVNSHMVLLGHAWVMRGNTHHLSEGKRDELNRMERWARHRRLGLWNTRNPIPPWQWRGTE